MANFNERLRLLRSESELSQAELAKRLGLTKSSVNMYERGDREPDIDTLKSIADYFGVSMDFLLGKTDPGQGEKSVIDRPPHSTSERLREIMDERGLRQADILKLAQPYVDKYGVKLAKNHLSQYVNGHVLPAQKKLTILGLALGVSEVWLMGYDVPKERNVEYTKENVTTLEQELLAHFRRIPESEQVLLVQMIKGVADSRAGNIS